MASKARRAAVETIVGSGAESSVVATAGGIVRDGAGTFVGADVCNCGIVASGRRIGSCCCGRIAAVRGVGSCAEAGVAAGSDEHGASSSRGWHLVLDRSLLRLSSGSLTTSCGDVTGEVSGGGVGPDLCDLCRIRLRISEEIPLGEKTCSANGGAKIVSKSSRRRRSMCHKLSILSADVARAAV